jgi:hypothetical protein
MTALCLSLLKKTHLSRYSGIALIPAMAGSLRRTKKYASILMILRALHLSPSSAVACYGGWTFMNSLHKKTFATSC